MNREQAIQLRAKIIGVHLRDARLASGKSMKALGEVIGLSAGTISSIEQGTNPPSLPELELVALFLGFPVNYFWGDEIISRETSPAEKLETKTHLELRHRTIAAMLRQARNEKNWSQIEVAQRTGISASRIRRYENGDTSVPMPELEILAGSLGYRVEDFSDTSGPVGEWMTQQKAKEQLDQLPKHLKEFISNPNNRPYLEAAQRLSHISTEKLRALGEVLAELIS